MRSVGDIPKNESMGSSDALGDCLLRAVRNDPRASLDAYQKEARGPGTAARVGENADGQALDPNAGRERFRANGGVRR